MNPLALLVRFWQPLVALACVVCITLTVRGYGERRYEMGKAEVMAADAAAINVLRAQNQKLEIEKLELAAQAHTTYEVDHAQNVFAARQPLSARELCLNADDRGRGMPEARTAQPGDAAQPAAAAVVQPVPAVDSGGSADRLRLLAALAGMADDDSAVIREYQAREITP